MVVKTIYVVRHGFRSNWVVNPKTGTYSHGFPTPTGIPSDPALAGHGVEQAEELAAHLSTLSPRPTAIYCSPFYRCLQTIKPFVQASNSSSPPVRIRVDTGLGEFYGLARFDHPIPATVQILTKHFPDLLDVDYAGQVVPAPTGESIPGLHDRVALALHRLLKRADAEGHEAILLCSHAAVMIAVGRALTGRMPEDPAEEDFKCATCAFSKYTRRNGGTSKGVNGTDGTSTGSEAGYDIGWRGVGVGGGWICEVNGDCSFLREGEERPWSFAIEEAVIAQQAAAAAAADVATTATTAAVAAQSLT